MVCQEGEIYVPKTEPLRVQSVSDFLSIGFQIRSHPFLKAVPLTEDTMPATQTTFEASRKLLVSYGIPVLRQFASARLSI